MPSGGVGARHVGDDEPGFVVKTAFPAKSTATHKDVEAHETQERPPLAATFPGALQIGDTAAGSVVMTALPPPSTPTQSVIDGHETPVRPCSSTFAGALHVGVAAVGLVVMTALPPPSIATHSDVEAQETAPRRCGLVNGGWWSTNTGADHDIREALTAAAATPLVAITDQPQTSQTSTFLDETHVLCATNPSAVRAVRGWIFPRLPPAMRATSPTAALPRRREARTGRSTGTERDAADHPPRSRTMLR